MPSNPLQAPLLLFHSRCAKPRKGLGAALLLAAVEDVIGMAGALSTRNTRHH